MSCGGCSIHNDPATGQKIPGNICELRPHHEEADRVFGVTARGRARSKPSYSDLEPAAIGRAGSDAVSDRRHTRSATELTAEERLCLSQGGTVEGKDGAAWGVGMRFNNGKAPVWRGFINYFPRAMEEVARVSGFGASKYAWNNWQKIDDYYDNISDSLSRHLVNEAKGRVNDIDSELLEAAHLAWNAMARLELMMQEKEKQNV